MTDRIYIPLGLRCSCAYVLDRELHLRRQSLPFDWIDLSCKAITNLASMPQDNIKGFVSDYLDNVTAQRHKTDGTYFPHHFIETDHPEKQLADLKVRFTFLFERFFGILNSRKRCVFLTVFPNVQSETAEDYLEMKSVVGEKTKGLYHFVSINGRFPKVSLSLHHTNINVPHPGDWHDFEVAIAKELRTNENISHLFV